MAGLHIPVMPYRRHIFITEAVAANRGGVEVPANRIMVIDFSSTFYFHREGGGILFGMSDPGEPPSFDLSVKWELLELITPIAARRLPVLQDLGIAHAWAGLYEMTPDAMPIIGPAAQPEGFFMINGFSGHGFQHSPAAGRLLAEMITGEQASDAAAFSLERFSRNVGGGEAAVI
jgi:sarcosine oxidase subunit beta